MFDAENHWVWMYLRSSEVNVKVAVLLLLKTSGDAEITGTGSAQVTR